MPLKAYAYFVQSCREEYERSHLNEPPNYTQFIRYCKARWDDMSDSGKAPFQRLEHENTPPGEGRLWEPQHYEEDEDEEHKSAKQRRPLSAFYCFCNDQRNIVMAENDDFDQCQVAVAMGRRWIAASSEIKQKYEKIAEEKRNQH